MASIKKKKDIKVSSGTMYVKTSINNTIITLVNEQWALVATAGTGTVWFKWAKENTPYAAETLAKKLLKDAKNFGLKEVWIIFKWVGLARDWVFKAINEVGLVDIMYVKENTPIQFGGCKGIRPKRA